MNRYINVKAGKMETEIKSYLDLKFEVKRRSCRLQVNEKVTPNTVVGRHYRTGQETRACCYGQVATIYFNPMHDSLMVMIIGTTAGLLNGSGI